jgi:hypothetical protein
MEGILTNFFSAETLVFCVVIALSVLITRHLVEGAAKGIAKMFPDKWEPFWIALWRENILPYLPVGMGGLLGWMVDAYPYPESFSATVTARIFFGIVCGLASGLVYRHVKQLARKMMPEKVEELEEKVGELPDSLTGNGDDDEDPSEEENGKDE